VWREYNKGIMNPMEDYKKEPGGKEKTKRKTLNG
jgi:hypothetical protein